MENKVVYNTAWLGGDYWLMMKSIMEIEKMGQILCHTIVHLRPFCLIQMDGRLPFGRYQHHFSQVFRFLVNIIPNLLKFFTSPSFFSHQAVSNFLFHFTFAASLQPLPHINERSATSQCSCYWKFCDLLPRRLYIRLVYSIERVPPAHGP